MQVGQFGLLEFLTLGGGSCLLLIALIVGLAIIIKVFGMIRSMIGKLVLVGCYLLIILGCCLLLGGGVLVMPLLRGG